MDTNLAAWMIAGGPRIAHPHAARDREQLVAFLESRRAARLESRRAAIGAPAGLVERFRRLVRPAPAACADLGCCPA
jgi:hypothetical protein